MLNGRRRLNGRNLLDDRDPIAQRANHTSGSAIVRAALELRSFIRKNAFTL